MVARVLLQLGEPRVRVPASVSLTDDKVMRRDRRTPAAELRAGLSVEQIARTWAPYLTMSEVLKLAVQTYTQGVHTANA